MKVTIMMYLAMAGLAVLMATPGSAQPPQHFSTTERAIGTTAKDWAFMTAWDLTSGELLFSPSWYNGTYTWSFLQPFYQRWIAKFIYRQSVGQTRELQWSYTQVHVQFPPAGQVTISGRITNAISGAGVDGVTVTFSSGGGVATTSGGGYYNREVDSGWSGSITPSGSGGAFVPISRSLNNLSGPAGDLNFALYDHYLVVDLGDGPMAGSYPASHFDEAPANGWTDEYKTTKMVFRLIPPGAFIMGSPTNELGRDAGEVQHEVIISRPFYLGVFEVTQKQWERVMGTWPASFTNINYRDTRPVESVGYPELRGTNNWPTDVLVDTNSFMGRLRDRTGWAFDLPTEAQWEYAVRAGTETALHSGYNLTSTSNDVRMAEVGRYRFNHPGGYSQNSNVSTDGGTAKVGSYLPNAWGLYDMHGNVWEWTLNWNGAYSGAATDPLGPTSGWFRIIRGGSWLADAFYCRSAQRSGPPFGGVGSGLGFRAALPSASADAP